MHSSGTRGRRFEHDGTGARVPSLAMRAVGRVGGAGGARRSALGGVRVGLGLLALAGFATADTHEDGSKGGAVRRGSQTEVDPGGVAPGRRVIGHALNVYVWGRPDPDSGRKSHDDGDWLEVKGGGGDVWSKGHVFDADHRSGASTLRGGGTSRASVAVHVTVPKDCEGWGTCSDAITIPWDYSVSGGGIHVLRCTGTAVDIKGGTHAFTLDPADLSSAHRVTGSVRAGESQRGSAKGTGGFPSLLKVEAYDEGTVTSDQQVTFEVTSSSAMAKSGVVVFAEVTDAKPIVGGSCSWEFGSGVLDTLAAQALLGRADTGLGRFDVLHKIETGWAIVCSREPTKSHGLHDLGPLPRTGLAPQAQPQVPLPDGEGSTGSGSQPGGDTATGRIVGPEGLAGEPGAVPGLLLLETDRGAGPALTWALAATPPQRLRLPPSLVVREGDASGTASYWGLEAGPFTLLATLLDAQGLMTSTTLELTGDSASNASSSSPRLSVRVDGWRIDVASGRWLALAGSDGAGLRVERTGFAGIEDDATTLALSTIDPSGVLRALPSMVTIPAGETSVRVPLALGDALGDAEVTVRCGELVERVALRSVRQALECPLAGVTVPVGGRAVLPLALAMPDDVWRVVDVTAADAAKLSVPTDASSLTFPPGSDGAWVAIHALAMGTTAVRAASAGLPDLDMPVTVVPTEVEMTRATVTLLGMSDGPAASTGGLLCLRLPSSSTWQSAAGDPAAGVEVVSGIGSDTLVVRVAPGSERDGSIVLPVTLAGAPSDPFEVAVNDRLHGCRSLYRIGVR